VFAEVDAYYAAWVRILLEGSHHKAMARPAPSKDPRLWSHLSLPAGEGAMANALDALNASSQMQDNPLDTAALVAARAETARRRLAKRRNSRGGAGNSINGTYAADGSGVMGDHAGNIDSNNGFYDTDGSGIMGDHAGNVSNNHNNNAVQSPNVQRSTADGTECTPVNCETTCNKCQALEEKLEALTAMQELGLTADTAWADMTSEERAAALLAMSPPDRVPTLASMSLEDRVAVLLVMTPPDRALMLTVMTAKARMETLLAMGPEDRSATMLAMSAEDLAEAFTTLSLEGRLAILRTLSPEEQARILSAMSAELRAQTLMGMSPEERAALLATLSPRDREAMLTVMALGDKAAIDTDALAQKEREIEKKEKLINVMIDGPEKEAAKTEVDSMKAETTYMRAEGKKQEMEQSAAKQAIVQVTVAEKKKQVESLPTGSKKAKVQQEWDEAEAELANIIETLESNTIALSELEEMAEGAHLVADVSTAKSNLKVKEQELAEMPERIAKASADFEAKKKEVAAMKRGPDKRKAQLELDTAEDELKMMQEQKDSAESEIAELQDEVQHASVVKDLFKAETGKTKSTKGVETLKKEIEAMPEGAKKARAMQKMEEEEAKVQLAEESASLMKLTMETEKKKQDAKAAVEEKRTAVEAMVTGPAKAKAQKELEGIEADLATANDELYGILDVVEVQKDSRANMAEGEELRQKIKTMPAGRKKKAAQKQLEKIEADAEVAMEKSQKCVGAVFATRDAEESAEAVEEKYKAIEEMENGLEKDEAIAELAEMEEKAEKTAQIAEDLDGAGSALMAVQGHEKEAKQQKEHAERLKADIVKMPEGTAKEIAVDILRKAEQRAHNSAEQAEAAAQVVLTQEEAKAEAKNVEQKVKLVEEIGKELQKMAKEIEDRAKAIEEMPDGLEKEEAKAEMEEMKVKEKLIRAKEEAATLDVAEAEKTAKRKEEMVSQLANTATALEAMDQEMKLIDLKKSELEKMSDGPDKEMAQEELARLEEQAAETAESIRQKKAVFKGDKAIQKQADAIAKERAIVELMEPGPEKEEAEQTLAANSEKLELKQQIVQDVKELSAFETQFEEQEAEIKHQQEEIDAMPDGPDKEEAESALIMLQEQACDMKEEGELRKEIVFAQKAADTAADELEDFEEVVDEMAEGDEKEDAKLKVKEQRKKVDAMYEELHRLRNEGRKKAQKQVDEIGDLEADIEAMPEGPDKDAARARLALKKKKLDLLGNLENFPKKSQREKDLEARVKYLEGLLMGPPVEAVPFTVVPSPSSKPKPPGLPSLFKDPPWVAKIDEDVRMLESLHGGPLGLSYSVGDDFEKTEAPLTHEMAFSIISSPSATPMFPQNTTDSGLSGVEYVPAGFIPDAAAFDARDNEYHHAAKWGQEDNAYETAANTIRSYYQGEPLAQIQESQPKTISDLRSDYQNQFQSRKQSHGRLDPMASRQYDQDLELLAIINRSEHRLRNTLTTLGASPQPSVEMRSPENNVPVMPLRWYSPDGIGTLANLGLTTEPAETKQPEPSRPWYESHLPESPEVWYSPEVHAQSSPLRAAGNGADGTASSMVRLLQQYGCHNAASLID